MNVDRELMRGLRLHWAVLGGLVLVSGLVLWWLADDGGRGEALAGAQGELAKLGGTVVLEQRLREQREANEHLRATIETLKARCGFRLAELYKVPAGIPQPGMYFIERMLAVQDALRPKAQARSVQYQERLGFERTAKVPGVAETPYLLAMLQITEKAAGIVLDNPGEVPPVERFAITQPEKGPVDTGTVGRPPLLREYPLRIELRAKLPTVLWILHRLAQVDGPDDFPLILRNLRIDGRNFQENTEVQSLDAVIEVAAMQFLSPEERRTAGVMPAGGRAGGLRGGGR